ncbi:MAG: ABC transporter ATP-binding protein [Candidatus Altiarchaeota archaeon]|nr:ABC transporter ATP-binding protein [Candidatus Altiarchaeota archaeon]
MGKERKTFLTYLGLYIVASLILLLEPLVVGLIFNSIQTDIITQASMKILLGRIWLLFAITIGFWAFQGVGRVLEQRTGFLVNRNYVNSTVDKILDLPLKWHKNHHTGDTIDKLNLSARALGRFSRHTTYRLVEIFVRIFGSLLILFAFDKTIALLAGVITAFAISVIILMDDKLNKKYTKLSKLNNKISSTIYDYFSNIRTVITLRLKATVKKKIASRITDTKKIFDESVIIKETKWAFSSLIISLMVVVSLSFKSYTEFSVTGTIMIGTLYILYGYLQTIGNTFYSVAGVYGDIVRKSAHLNNAEPIHSAYKRRARKIKTNPLSKDWQELKIENLHFKYEDEEKLSHLRGINLKLKRGQKIALIGESGSGKSTILALLRGIYEPNSVEVFRDGEKLPHGLSHLRKHTTLIPQDPEIFNTTLKSNITMDLPAQASDIKKVVNVSRLKPVLKKLTKGLDTNIMEKGVSLSGGESQRLALARGLLAAKNSDILLLDEPTSSVDSVNERHIHKNISKTFKDKTIVASIHRLQMLSNFDYIYMLDKGKVVAEGDLKTLRKNSRFSKIWKIYKKS